MNEHETQALEAARRAVDAAKKAGAEAAEATVSIARRFHAEARDAALARLEGSTGRSLRVRVLGGGRKATLSTSDLSPDGIAEAIARTVAQAQWVAQDEFVGLPDRFAGDVPDLGLYDPAVAERPDAEKVEEVLELERLVRGADPRIVNSGGSHYTDATSTIALANTAGFEGAYTSTRATRSTGPVAADGPHKRTAHYGTAGRRLADLESVEAVARTAVKRTLDSLGARKPATMQAPVIFDRDVAASILEDLFAALSAANVATGNSWLIGRTGTAIASPSVTIVDDGRMRGTLGSSPFDGEGVATRRTPVISAGVLETFLYDTYYARKLGANSTGNSTGGGIGTNTLYLEPGSGSLEELIARTPRGVLVVETIGFATEHASGTYSRGARGFAIEGGELAYPIDEFTIAGTFLSMLGGIDAIAADLRFDSPVASPSFRVAEMTVSGN